MTNGADGSKLRQLEERLTARFVPPLEPADVVSTIDEALARFHNAPVRTYVLLLVERIAADRLRMVMAAGDRLTEEPWVAPSRAIAGSAGLARRSSTSAEGHALAGVRGVGVR